MIVADGAERVEAAQVVFVRRVVAVPGDHVQRRMIDAAPSTVPAEFRHQLEVPVAILVRGDRREEIARIRQPVRADRPEIREPQRRAEVLAT